MRSIKKRFEELKSAFTHNGTLMHTNKILQRAAQLWPTNTALIYEDTTINYQELYRRSIALGNKLQTNGVQPGDRVIVLYENSINFYIAYYAAWQIGAIVVPLNVYLHEQELKHIVHDAQPKIIIASEKQHKKLEKLSNLPPIIGEQAFVISGSQEIAQLDIPRQGIDTCTVLLYTSGTTGLPKGVMLSARNILLNCLQGIANFKVDKDERVFAALPLFHSFMQNAAVWSPFLMGATVIIVPGITRTALLQGLKHQPTAMLGIPQLYGLFCLMKTASFKQVKYFISGGDALHNKIRMGFELIYQRKIVNGYGLTETSPFISVDLDDDRKPAGCIGKPLEGIQVEIRDTNDNPLGPCKEGILWVKGDNVMLGYYNAPEQTTKVLQDEWLNTGDLAYIDKAGYIVLCGREKDLIIHKGFNIYPQEIENILTSHHAVFQAGVVGQQSDGDEIPVAFIAAKDAPENLIEQLKELCARNLARYKIPVHFYIKKELPTTATGKVDKKILRKELQQIPTKE